MFDTPLGDSRAIGGSRWLTAGIVLVMGLITTTVLSTSLSSDHFLGWWILGTAVSVAAAAWWSPLRPGRHQPIAETALSAPEVVVLWRPGCAYSAQLHRDLERAHRHVTWVNIWRDPAAAAICRRLNCGEEQVPTAMIVDRSQPRPTVIPATLDGILQAIREIRPHPRRASTSPRRRPGSIAA